jgi:hypothetical protein
MTQTQKEALEGYATSSGYSLWELLTPATSYDHAETIQLALELGYLTPNEAENLINAIIYKRHNS